MNFKEEAFVSRLKEAESSIESIIEGHKQLLTRIKKLEKDFLPPEEKEERIRPKYNKLKLVNDLIYFVDVLKLKFQRDKLAIEHCGVEYHELEDFEYTLHMIQAMSEALYAQS